MILIAESGSTKSHWILCDENGSFHKEFKTIGLNPYFTKKNVIASKLRNVGVNEFNNEVKHIFFYGAGCSRVEKSNIIKDALKEIFTKANIIIKHDLEAACISLYKKEPNITRSDK